MTDALFALFWLVYSMAITGICFFMAYSAGVNIDWKECVKDWAKINTGIFGVMAVSIVCVHSFM